MFRLSNSCFLLLTTASTLLIGFDIVPTDFLVFNPRFTSWTRPCLILLSFFCTWIYLIEMRSALQSKAPFSEFTSRKATSKPSLHIMTQLKRLQLSLAQSGNSNLQWWLLEGFQTNVACFPSSSFMNNSWSDYCSFSPDSGNPLPSITHRTLLISLTVVLDLP